MKVHVEFMGPILRPAGTGKTAELELEVGATVSELLVALGYRPEHARYLGVFRDGQRPLRLDGYGRLGCHL